jgi:hypothetical protein
VARRESEYMLERFMSETSASPSHQEQLSQIINLAIYEFSQNVEGLRAAYRIARESTLAEDDKCFEAIKEFLLSNSIGRMSDDMPGYIIPVSPFPPEHWREYNRLALALDKARRGNIVTVRSFLVSLVSVLDIFMASIFRFVFMRTPERLNKKGALTFEQMSDFDSIESARLFLIEREIDSLLRESRMKQFDWLEENVGVKFRRNDDIWANAVELEQRRHIFVHCDGRVTNDYIRICRASNVKLPPALKAGDTLLNLPEYFEHTCCTALDVGIRIAQVVWRKLLPDDRKADHQFLMFCYHRIVEEEYGVACRALWAVFKESLFKLSSQDTEFRCLLNLAQTYKWAGHTESCSELLASRDFSATKPLFRLAKASLEEQWEDAFRLFEEVGGQSDMKAEDYRAWPIFRQLRERPEFPALFERVFGTPLLIADTIEPTDRDSESYSSE